MRLRHIAVGVAAAGGALGLLLLLLPPPRAGDPARDPFAGELDGPTPVATAREVPDLSAQARAPRLHAVGDVADAGDVWRLREVALYASEASQAVHALLVLGRHGRVGDDAALVGLVHDARPAVRDQAILALAAGRDPRCVDDLAPLLASTDLKARWLAIHALGEIGGEHADVLLAGTLAETSAGPAQALPEAEPPRVVEPYDDR